MPHCANKELVLGIMVGTAGISLLLLWYQKIRKPRIPMNLPKFLSLGKTFDTITLQDEMYNDQGAAVIFQERQLQILEKLNELLTNMEELKEEIRFLKETIPKLEEYIQGELGGKTTVHKISPQHRARKRRLPTVQSSATSNSSEEAESEGGCCKENQSFQPYENQVTSDLRHHGASSVSQSSRYLGLKTSHPSATRKANLSRGRKCLWISSSSSFPEKRCSLSFKFRKSNTSIYRQQSRANFDSQEDLSNADVKSSSDHFDVFRPHRRFSSCKLSIVSCYKTAICFDPQSDSQNMFNMNEIELFSRNQSNTDADKHISLSAPKYTTKHFKNFETRAPSPAHAQNAIDGISNQQNTAPFFSLATVVASPHQENGIATDIQQRGQINKDVKDSLCCGSQSHSTKYSPAMVQQHPCQHVASPVLHGAAFSSSPKKAGSFSQNEVTSGWFEDENLSQNEDISSPVEIPLKRSSQTLPLLQKGSSNQTFSHQSPP